YSIGGTHRRLARLPGDESERRMHVKAVRTAWMSIEFTDLVQELDDEFGTEGWLRKVLRRFRRAS
ncbi:MAG: hypothetical protein OEU26_10660, partial [Candidatus Tectomicrobia bacterium]|nr:hypothetical protein [Candidatus Tectomicrobia bacterium]